MRNPSPALLAALFALLVQAFVVQPHIHFDTNWDVLASLQTPLTSHSSAELPAALSDNDSSHCLICHEQMSGGRALVLDAIHVLPPNVAIFVALYAKALSAAYGIVSHSWQGRGPPRV